MDFLSKYAVIIAFKNSNKLILCEDTFDNCQSFLNELAKNVSNSAIVKKLKGNVFMINAPEYKIYTQVSKSHAIRRCKIMINCTNAQYDKIKNVIADNNIDGYYEELYNVETATIENGTMYIDCTLAQSIIIDAFIRKNFEHLYSENCTGCERDYIIIK